MGFFKKLVIADSCAVYTNLIFDNYQDFKGSTLLLGAIFFAIQIYGDFSGYSDIAIGTARLFGFDLMQNFAYPYFSRDIAEFWRRWHISLSTWFRDYVYIPLGGSKGSLLKKIRNVYIIFLVSGFWHGANWTFIIWGAINACYFLPLLLVKKNRAHINIVAENKILPSVKETFQITLTFLGTTLAWVFFRAPSLNDAICYLKIIFSSSFFSMPTHRPSLLLFLVTLFFTIEWFGKKEPFAIANLPNKIHVIPRYAIYLIISYFILFHFKFHEAQEFIYFQF